MFLRSSLEFEEKVMELAPEKIFIGFGGEGTGKTTSCNDFSSAHGNSILISGKKRGHFLKPLESALSEINNKNYDSPRVKELMEDLQYMVKGNEFFIIIDNAEDIDKTLFEEMINLKRKGRDLKLYFVFIFNRTKDQLNLCKIYTELTSIFFNPSFFEFEVTESDREISFKKAFPQISKKNVEILLSHSNNLYDTNQLINALQIHNMDIEKNDIEEKFINNCWRDIINTKFRKLDKGLQDILKKSSTIGMGFSEDPLESAQAFNIRDIQDKLEEIKSLQIYIEEVERELTRYRFKTKHIHEGILNNIDFKEKEEYNRILAEYYVLKASSEIRKDLRAERLELAIWHYMNASQIDAIAPICLELLTYYNSIGDRRKEIEKIKEVIRTDLLDQDLGVYLLFQLAKRYVGLGEYSESKKYFEILLKVDNIREGSKQIIKYHLAESKYNCGLAHETIDDLGILSKELIDVSEPQDIRSPGINSLRANEKYLLALVRSALSSVYKNLNDDHNGEALKYYKLARETAKDPEVLKTHPDLYYKILRKASMFIDAEIDISEYFEKACKYFEDTENEIELAKTLHNYATYHMFNCDFSENTFGKFKNALEIFENKGSKFAALVWNNIGIYYSLIGQPDLAEDSFHSALVAGIEEFHFFSLYSNFFMHHLKNRNSDLACIYLKKMEEIYEKQKNIENSNFMYRLYYLFDIFLYNEWIGNHEKMMNTIKELDEHCKTPFYIDLLEGMKKRAGLKNIERETSLKLLSRFNEDKLFYAELLFWE